MGNDLGNHGSAKPRVRSAWRWLWRLLGVSLAICVAGILWLNFAGLPQFARTRLLDRMRTADFDLRATRIRLEGVRRLVVEQLEMRPRETNGVPRIQIAEAELELNGTALRRLRLEPHGLTIRDGQLEWVVERPGHAAETLLVTNLQSDLLFLPGNEWRLTDLKGETAGARILIEASVKNPLALSSWPSSSPDPQVPPVWREQVGELLRFLREVEFGSQPELTLHISGDAEDWTTFEASAHLSARGVQSKWLDIQKIELESRLHPTNQAFENHTFGRVEGVQSEWLRLGHAEVQGRAVIDTLGADPSTANVHLSLKDVRSAWVNLDAGEASITSTQDHARAVYQTQMRGMASPMEVGSWQGTNLVMHVDLEHSLPMPSLPELMGRWLPGAGSAVRQSEGALTNHLAGSWGMELDRIQAPRFSADSLRLFGTVERITPGKPEPDPALRFWNWLRPYTLGWNASLSNIHTREVQLGSVRGEGKWLTPAVELKSITAELYGGGLEGAGSLNVESRVATATVEADFDYHKAALLLEKPVQRWMGQFSWEEPPWVEASLKAVLPEWAGAWTNIGRQLLPSLEIEGQLRGAGAFRGVPAEHATSHFRFTNFVWHLPNLEVIRPEGRAHLAYTGNVSNQNFTFEVLTQIDPHALKPLFPEEQHEFFDHVQFPEPPTVSGVANGRWGADEMLSADLQIAVTNFIIKGEQYSDLVASLNYTNLIVEAHDLVAHRGKEEVRAPYLRIDITNETMFVTNAVSNSDPHVAMKLIGDKVYKAIDPYRFASPPSVRINGIVPLRHHTKSDLHFEVAGEDFTFWKFRIPYLVGDVFWKGDYLSFSNVQASFYGGEGTWSASFFFDEENDAEFSFSARTVNSDLKPLIHDLFDGAKQMEGTFRGDLVITSAQSRDDRSWDGFGSVRLEDGFLWNIPVFGVFSPMLESISPGLGTSRVSAGTADFTLTNSVFHSENMEVRAPAFRLRYDGMVDLDGNIEADVEAILLRDTWLFGPVVSLALWPVSKAFEARVSGTVAEPETKLKYVPRFLLAPFRALTTIPEVEEKAGAPSEDAPGKD